MTLSKFFSALLTLLVFSPAVIAHPHPPQITTYNLPGNKTFPEGVARQPDSPYFYTGSFTDGTIFRGDVRTTNVEVFIPAEASRPSVVGMKVDTSGRLYVVGNNPGVLYVYDTTTRSLLHRFHSNLNGAFLNDLAFADDGTAYITDSFFPHLYYVTEDKLDGPLDQDLEMFTMLPGLPTPGVICANGIVVTEDQEYLIFGNWTERALYRVCLETREVDLIDLCGKEIGSVDGLLLRDSLLYSVNSNYTLGIFIDVIEIEPPYLEATPIRRITSPLLVGPATAAWDEDDLLVTNFQVGSTAPVLPFTVVRVSAD